MAVEHSGRRDLLAGPDRGEDRRIHLYMKAGIFQHCGGNAAGPQQLEPLISERQHHGALQADFTASAINNGRYLTAQILFAMGKAGRGGAPGKIGAWRNNRHAAARIS